MLFLNEQTVVNPTRNTLSNDIDFVMEAFQLSESMEELIKVEYAFLNEEVDAEKKDSKVAEFFKKAKEFVEKILDRFIAKCKEFVNKCKKLLSRKKENSDTATTPEVTGDLNKIPKNTPNKLKAIRTAYAGLYLSFTERFKKDQSERNKLVNIKERYFSGSLDEPYSSDLVEVTPAELSDFVKVVEEVLKNAEDIRNNLKALELNVLGAKYSDERKAAAREYFALAQTITAKGMEFLSVINKAIGG